LDFSILRPISFWILVNGISIEISDFRLSVVEFFLAISPFDYAQGKEGGPSCRAKTRYDPGNYSPPGRLCKKERIETKLTAFNVKVYTKLQSGLLPYAYYRKEPTPSKTEWASNQINLNYTGALKAIIDKKYRRLYLQKETI